MTDREKLVELLEERRMQASEVLGSMHKGFGAWYADHLIANGVTMPEIVCDRFIYDAHNGVWIHQFRFKLGDKDWGVSKELPAELVAEAMDQQKWISVKDRLPGHELVLCYKAGRGVRIGKLLDATYADGAQAFMDSYRTFAFGVTHWMPLPEVPKGD